MKIVLATDVRAYKYKNRLFFMKDVFGVILERYVHHFGTVSIVSRIVEVDEINDKMKDYTDLIAESVFVKSFSELLKSEFSKNLHKMIDESDLVVVRAPSFMSIVAVGKSRKLHKPYLSEAMGCAWDAYWNHGLSGKVIAPFMYLAMKSIFWNADYALYVTQEFLQNRYPSQCKSVGVSNIKLLSVDKEVLTDRLKRIQEHNSNEIKLMTSAAVDVRFKGQEFVIKAISGLAKKGIKVKYYLAGGGDQTYLRECAKQEGVLDSVVFLGLLSKEEVFMYLDQVDGYIQPSLQEGLPRSVIEAMSRGCVCFGARTAGIPELLEPEYVVERKSIQGIVDSVTRYMRLGVEEKKRVANRNFNESNKYLSDVLDKRRRDYFLKIKAECELKK